MVVRKAFITTCLLAITILGYSQKGTNNPYSIFGIGELNSNQYATFAAMGGTQMANSDSTNVNFLNPSTYAYFKRHKPIFQVGINSKFSRFETSDALIDKNTGGLNQFQIGLPIKKRWGAALGIMPYSFSGYTVSNYVLDSADTTHQFVNEGSGGVSQAYFGVACKVIDFAYVGEKIRKRATGMADGKAIVRGDTVLVDRKHILSLGFNGNFLFGTANKKRSYEHVWPITGYNARVENGLRVSDVTTDLALNYQYYFESDSSAGSFSLGATYTPKRRARAFRDIYSYNYLGSFYQPNRPVTVYDTVEFSESSKGYINIPESYKVGLEYRFGPGRNSNSQLRLAVDWEYQKWSTYEENFGDGATYDDLLDRKTISFGLEYVPITTISYRSNKTPYLGTIRYRLGFNYTQTEWQVQNDLGTNAQIADYGMSFGLGFPITGNNSNTSINFGANFGNLGTTDNGLIRQRYIGVFFGLSLTPGRGNYWFIKRKYD